VNVRAVTAAAIVICSAQLLVFAQTSTDDDRCQLPSDLQDEVSKAYPDSSVIKLNDLSPDDREFFRKDHATDCPGLVRVDFFGDGKPTLAMVLLDSTKKKLHLIVANRPRKMWEFRQLDTLDAGPIPAAWQDKPGRYDDVYGKKTLIAIHPVIVLCRYEAWAIVYDWTGRRIEKVWISD
jgi:hypothetical protein